MCFVQAWGPVTLCHVDYDYQPSKMCVPRAASEMCLNGGWHRSDTQTQSEDRRMCLNELHSPTHVCRAEMKCTPLTASADHWLKVCILRLSGPCIYWILHSKVIQTKLHCALHMHAVPEINQCWRRDDAQNNFFSHALCPLNSYIMSFWSHVLCWLLYPTHCWQYNVAEACLWAMWYDVLHGPAKSYGTVTL